MNLNNKMNNSISHYSASDIRRNDSDAMLETSSLQTKNKVGNPYLSRNNSNGTSTASSAQCKNKAINSDTTNLNPSSNNHLVEKSDKETNANLMNLDRNAILNRLTNLKCNHKVNSTDALLMHIATLNIQWLNEYSNAFQTEIKNNIEENKECNEENSTSNFQQNTKDSSND